MRRSGSPDAAGGRSAWPLYGQQGKGAAGTAAPLEVTVFLFVGLALAHTLDAVRWVRSVRLLVLAMVAQRFVPLSMHGHFAKAAVQHLECHIVNVVNVAAEVSCTHA
jgi:hypothetical protein